MKVTELYLPVMQVCRRTVQNVNMAKEEIQQEIDDLRESLRAAHKLILKYKTGNDPDSNRSTPDVSM
ncbi:unnamed protein product [Cylicostephanus goldi]|uniref:Uncharacterized protein n=1 Tax=Cylicostephanus goldi TaxID=71465 RepID=A0A3P6T895_CYLGO|nr:unnamed protein product [Cylicostephanus goldi]